MPLYHLPKDYMFDYNALTFKPEYATYYNGNKRELSEY